MMDSTSLTMPLAIHDRRDVVGTLRLADARSGQAEPVVTLPRDLAERALAALRSTLTPRGHLALKVLQEGKGGCGWRSEAPSCVERRALIEEVAAVVEGT